MVSWGSTDLLPRPAAAVLGITPGACMSCRIGIAVYSVGC